MRFKNRQFKAPPKWIAAVVSAIVTVFFVCVAVTVLASGVGRLFGPGEKSRLIRISALAPLSTSMPTSLPPPTRKPDTITTTTAMPSGSTPLSLPENQPPVITQDNSPEPPPAIIPDGYAAPVTRVVIPRLNLDAPVALSPLENQTWKVDHLNQAVGYLEGTALPGSNSNVVLAGHVTLASGIDGPFVELDQLAPNDEIIVYSNGQEFVYMVNNLQSVNRDSVQVTYPSSTAEITLITCSNWSRAESRYTNRLVVKGYLKN